MAGCAAKGWWVEVWSGAGPVVLRNVRLLAAGRRADPPETQQEEEEGEEE
jgi:hypothetical protein